MLTERSRDLLLAPSEKTDLRSWYLSVFSARRAVDFAEV
jgi:hypothetical protein